jgi:hypothetical protein
MERAEWPLEEEVGGVAVRRGVTGLDSLGRSWLRAR